MDDIWFTADSHFSHVNILKYCDRPFRDVAEMDRAMVERWNAVVRPDDTVYHLGDFTLGGWYDITRPLLDELNGHIKIVPGGHDWRWLPDADGRLEVLPPLMTLEFDVGEKYPLVVVLCHYPMLSWDRSHYGSIHLHGHSHGTIPDSRSSDVKMPPGQRRGFRLDVGVDCHHFSPVNLAEILEMANHD
jgi:calcineurin-like phosphoesterase family protein